VVNDTLWCRLCVVLSLPELVEDPRFASNDDWCRNRADLERLLKGR
jgi:crotonobetainyl-CoA:carnitine CoA-transferase CaiB-like acyl-CoA transferase